MLPIGIVFSPPLLLYSEISSLPSTKILALSFDHITGPGQFAKDRNGEKGFLVLSSADGDREVSADRLAFRVLAHRLGASPNMWRGMKAEGTPFDPSATLRAGPSRSPGSTLRLEPSLADSFP